MSPRAVFDCMVCLQSVTNERGLAFACLHLVEEGRLSLVITPQVLSEVAAGARPHENPGEVPAPHR
jgi:hypothetical protein